jgi:hypothetical protein
MPGRTIALVAAIALISATELNAETPAASARGTAAAHRRPIAFEANTSRADAHVRYIARANGFRLLLTSQGMTVARGRDAITLTFAGSAPDARLVPIGRLPGGSNYLIGADRTKWRTGVPSFSQVRYDDLYPGIDMLVYAHDLDVEYDLVVRPGADPHTIRLKVDGATNLRVVEGDLVGEGAAGQIRLRQPVIYQTTPKGERRTIDGRYRISPGRMVTFDVGEYDRSRSLVIDPVVVYSTYLGGSSNDLPGGWMYGGSQTIAVDATGAAYVTGTTDVPTPTSDNPFQMTLIPFVTKIAPDGQSLVYSTYLGGTDGAIGFAIAVDAAGQAHVAGYMTGNDFPTTPGAVRHNNGRMFLTKLDPGGSNLVYSAIWGSGYNEVSTAVAVDSAGNAYVTGTTQTDGSTGLLLSTPGSAQESCRCFAGSASTGGDAFVVKFNSTATGLVYGTYLGGWGPERATGIAVNGAGEAYVTGFTSSTNNQSFPLVSAVQPLYGGGLTDAFVAKVSADGSQFLFSTYLGGIESESRDSPVGIAVDGAGNAYVTGYTSSADYPITPGSFQPVKPGSAWPAAWQAYVTKLTPAGQIWYSTFLGGNGGSRGVGIAVDAAGRAHVVGGTASTNFPAVDSIQPYACCSDDAFLTILSADGSTAEFSTYLGGPQFELPHGVAVGGDGSVYVAGQTLGGPGFPTTPNAVQPDYGGGASDLFVVRIQFAQPDTTAPSIGEVADISVETGSSDGAVVTFTLPAVSDNTDPAPTLSAEPASGSVFPVGSTTVTVTAEDAAGNTSTKTFTVTVVLSPAAMLAALADESSAFKQGRNLLRNAQRNLEDGQVTAACNQIGAFMNQVQAQSGKSVPAAQAAAWLARAASIRSALGCG